MTPSADDLSKNASEIVLVGVTPEDARAILSGAAASELNVPGDYPSEFSSGIAQAVGNDGQVGPFFVSRRSDGLIVGEIGGAFVDPLTIEIGYAVVDSQSGQGYATDAVVEFAKRARRDFSDARRLIAHAPIDRPASSRVLSKAGFRNRGQVEDEHEGERISVEEWEFDLGSRT